ncbi:MAG: CoA-binding protein [Deltaproteobacteria bacterium]|nr:CoA-binding protein [Deltaproteobacteria bacterium]
MYGRQDTKIQLDAIFHPESVALVGLPRGSKMGKIFLTALVESGFEGAIYPVNRKTTEIEGLKTYPSVMEIPHPVDLAVILVPNHSALSVVRECAAKGVRGAVLFTGGYRETGSDEGKALEEELVREAQASGLRLFGPNCQGLYCPASRISFYPGFSMNPGPVGVISQSGSLATILCNSGPGNGIYFSKVVSLGNECDVSSMEMIKYLKADSDTGVIGAYLEGIRDGDGFLKSLRETTVTKPVVLWKVGTTPEGSRAAASHTGALAGSWEIWESTVRNEGGVLVSGLEAWIDALMGFSLMPSDLGDRLALVSGPGGLALSGAEACKTEGLRLSDMSNWDSNGFDLEISSRKESTFNPIDLGSEDSLAPETCLKVVRTVANELEVDAVVLLGTGLGEDANRRLSETIIQGHASVKKPLLVVGTPGANREIGQRFCNAGIPFFESAERAMKTYALVHRYQLWRKHRKLSSEE